MDLSNLQRAELIAAVGGLLLALSILRPAYSPSDNPNALVEGSRAALSAWQVHDLLRWALLVAAAAPLVLSYVILRDHELSWPRGELTAVIGIFAVGLVLYNGVLDRLGEPSAQIALAIGWYGMLLGAILIAAGGAMRSGESQRRRKPPGAL